MGKVCLCFVSVRGFLCRLHLCRCGVDMSFVALRARAALLAVSAKKDVALSDAICYFGSGTYSNILSLFVRQCPVCIHPKISPSKWLSRIAFVCDVGNLV